ncbi:MAG: acyl-CoA thioesterase [Thioalkalispiraceae bacterium]|jgi:acyl-CoA thioesterase YciA
MSTHSEATPSDIVPKDKQPEIRVLAMPADTNAAGDIFGGWLMSQVDIAGSIVAYRIANGRVVTVAVNDFQFIKPVYVGDLVSIFAELIHVGNSSMQVEVTAFAERERGEFESLRVAQATLTYVAISKDGKPRNVKKQ